MFKFMRHALASLLVPAFIEGASNVDGGIRILFTRFGSWVLGMDYHGDEAGSPEDQLLAARINDAIRRSLAPDMEDCQCGEKHPEKAKA
jgi:hypothetical protein